MIWLHICMLLSAFSTQLFAAGDGSMKQVYETQIFENDALDIDLKEMLVLHWETSLNLHWKRRRWNTIQGYNWINQIGRHFILPKDDDILTCRYNPDEFLTQSIYKFLADESSKTADKQHIGWVKFDDLCKTHVLDTCQSLTLAIDEMARFRVRNYLKSRTLGYCEEFSKRWTVNSKICDNILIDDEKIAKFVYQLVLKQNEQPTAQSCKNSDEIQD